MLNLPGYFSTSTKIVGALPMARRRRRLALLIAIGGALAAKAQVNLGDRWGTGFQDILDRAGELQDCGLVAPHTCTSRGFDCEGSDDGCGTALDCGVCPEQHVCASNVCICIPKTCVRTAPAAAPPPHNSSVAGFCLANRCNRADAPGVPVHRSRRVQRAASSTAAAGWSWTVEPAAAAWLAPPTSAPAATASRIPAGCSTPAATATATATRYRTRR